MPKKFLERFRRLDNLIRTKSTGTPEDLAKKMELSESTIYEYLSIMKEFGAPIEYDKIRGSYYYTVAGDFHIKFVESSI